MPRCECGAVIPGWDCPHCKETKLWRCLICDKDTLIYNEAKMVKVPINDVIEKSVGLSLDFIEEN